MWRVAAEGVGGGDDGGEKKKKRKMKARKRKDQRVSFGREEWYRRRLMYGGDLSGLNFPAVIEAMLSM